MDRPPGEGPADRPVTGRVTVQVAETTLAIELDHGETRVIRRTTTTAVRNIKADRPRTAPSVS
jgi:hypothetical protein